jgi:hypothetical protein
VTWFWKKMPPVMERTLYDDVKVGLFVFTGAILGYLVFSPGDPSVLLGAFGGLVIALVVINVVRFFARRRHP